MTGIAVSGGYGIGKAVVVKSEMSDILNTKVKDTAAELKRFDTATEEFCKRTEQKASKIASVVGQKARDILTGHITMLKDPAMKGEMTKLIQNGDNAPFSVKTVCEKFEKAFASTGDEVMMQRAQDVEDIKAELLGILMGEEHTDLTHLPQNSVVFCKEFTPSMFGESDTANIVGIVTELGGKTSHSAILANSLGIACVMGVGETKDISDGEIVIVDGQTGEVFLNPDSKQLDEYSQRLQSYNAEKTELKKYLQPKTQTADGAEFSVYCNVGNSKEVQNAVANGAEGVGLFRTEFLFMDRHQEPSEEEQLREYQGAANAMNGKIVIIRTLDVGGDKKIEYLHQRHEENPFLGFRGIRYFLKNESLCKTQLRAIMRAGAGADVRIMLPMVTTVCELRKVRNIVCKIASELETEGKDFCPNPKIGVMMETPASCMIADALAKEADFFSIGTNDLTQYIMASDRGNADSAYLFSAYDPAVLRAIRHIIECAKGQKIEVGMCGEAASDKCLVPLWIAFGLDEFSVSPQLVTATRREIARWSTKAAFEVAWHAMELCTEAEVRKYLSQAIKNR